MLEFFQYVCLFLLLHVFLCESLGSVVKKGIE